MRLSFIHLKWSFRAAPPLRFLFKHASFETAPDSPVRKGWNVNLFRQVRETTKRCVCTGLWGFIDRRAIASHLVWVWGESQCAGFVTTKINYPLRIQRLVTEVCTIATIPNNRKSKIATRLQEHKFWPLTFFTSRHFCPLISRVQKTFANTTQRWWGYICNFPQRSICGACLNCAQK